MICPHCGNDTEQQPIVVNLPGNINGCNPLPGGHWITFTLNTPVVAANPGVFLQPGGAAACANVCPLNQGTLTIKI